MFALLAGLAVVLLFLLVWRFAVPYSGFSGGMAGTKTAVAGTAYYVMIPPYSTGPAAYQAFTAVMRSSWTNSGATANLVTGMRPIGRTTALGASTTASNTIALLADPSPAGNTMAAGDQVIVANVKGTFDQYQVGSFNATSFVVTVTAANLANNVAGGARFWMFGVFTDTDPVTNLAFPGFPTVGSATNNAIDAVAAGLRGAVAGDPLLLYNPNATAQSVHNFSDYTYTRE